VVGVAQLRRMMRRKPLAPTRELAWSGYSVGGTELDVQRRMNPLESGPTAPADAAALRGFDEICCRTHGDAESFSVVLPESVIA